MNLTDEQLNQVKELSGLFFSPEEIAVLMSIDRLKFCEEIAYKSSPIYDFYLSGKTLKKKIIRENVIKMATHGSPQAEELAEKYIKDQDLEERKNERKNS